MGGTSLTQSANSGAHADGLLATGRELGLPTKLLIGPDPGSSELPWHDLSGPSSSTASSEALITGHLSSAALVINSALSGPNGRIASNALDLLYRTDQNGDAHLVNLIAAVHPNVDIAETAISHPNLVHIDPGLTCHLLASIVLHDNRAGTRRRALGELYRIDPGAARLVATGLGHLHQLDPGLVNMAEQILTRVDRTTQVAFPHDDHRPAVAADFYTITGLLYGNLIEPEPRTLEMWLEGREGDRLTLGVLSALAQSDQGLISNTALRALAIRDGELAERVTRLMLDPGLPFTSSLLYIPHLLAPSSTNGGISGRERAQTRAKLRGNDPDSQRNLPGNEYTPPSPPSVWEDEGIIFAQQTDGDCITITSYEPLAVDDEPGFFVEVFILENLTGDTSREVHWVARKDAPPEIARHLLRESQE